MILPNPSFPGIHLEAPRLPAPFLLWNSPWDGRGRAYDRQTFRRVVELRRTSWVVVPPSSCTGRIVSERDLCGLLFVDVGALEVRFFLH